MPGILNNQENEPYVDNTNLEKTEGATFQENTIKNPLLQKIVDGIEVSVPKNLKEDYLRVVTAGMRVMFDKKTFNLMRQRFSQAQNIPEAVSTGIADLLALLYNESKKQMSIPASIFGAFILMVQALDFMEKAGQMQVTNTIIDQCTDATWKAVTEKFGMSQEKINSVIAQSQEASGMKQGQEPLQQTGMEI